jgi:hypothetical protein
MQNFILLGLVVLATTETLKLVALVEELVGGLEVHGEVALAAEQLAADAALVRCGLLVPGLEKTRVKKKKPAQCFFLFFRVFWVFLGFFGFSVSRMGFLGFSVSRILLGASRL